MITRRNDDNESIKDGNEHVSDSMSKHRKQRHAQIGRSRFAAGKIEERECILHPIPQRDKESPRDDCNFEPPIGLDSQPDSHIHSDNEANSVEELHRIHHDEGCVEIEAKERCC